jgi:hypothetical protein
MPIPQFDIFLGAPDKNAMWLECADNFDSAKAKMRKLATENPGTYFLFSSTYRKVLEVIDNSRKEKA